MKASDLRAGGAGELQTQLEELLREQFNLRMRKGTEQLSRPSQMRATRRDIARIKTLMTELKAGGGK